VTAGMHHFHARRRAAPARRLLGKGRLRLEPFAPTTLGLDIAGLLAAVERWEEWLTEAAGEPPPLPRLRLMSPGGQDPASAR
ncbi:MAG: DUF309 domain-containing protein, partial [Acidobacteriota bacterium]|nr:DUF309 domain-containing protein [Acidobacteriota bacterium]